MLKSLFIAVSIGTLLAACIGISTITELVKPKTRAPKMPDTTFIYGCYSVSNGAHVLDSTETAVIDPNLEYFADKEYSYQLIPAFSFFEEYGYPLIPADSLFGDTSFIFDPYASVPHIAVMHFGDDQINWFTLVYVRHGTSDVLAVVKQISDCSKGGVDIHLHNVWNSLHDHKHDFYVILGGQLVAKTRRPPIGYRPRVGLVF